MPILVNNETCKKVYFTNTNNGYNNVEIDNVRFNNVLIYKKHAFYDIIDNTEFTQADMVEMFNSVNAGGISLSDYRNKLVGKIVTLNNSNDYRTYLPGQYIIADVNHQDKYSDSTSYTNNSIDLIATNSIMSPRYFSITISYGKWSTSGIRTWLNDDFKNGFDTEIQELMSQMIVESYLPGTTSQSGGITVTANNNTTDYVKLLSCTELNLSAFHSYMSAREGTPYSDVFTSSAYNDTTNTSRIKGSNTSSSGDIWWTRSMYCYNASNVWYVSTDGHCSYQDGDIGTCCIVPVIRLKAV